MNHHITKTAKEVLWDFQTGITPLRLEYMEDCATSMFDLYLLPSSL